MTLISQDDHLTAGAWAACDLSMRKLSNLSPFGNLSHGVFSSVDLFFRGRGPINITGAVFGNPRFHSIKTVLRQTVLTHLFR